MAIDTVDTVDTTDTIDTSTPMDLDDELFLTSMNSINLNSDKHTTKMAQKIKFSQNKCVSGPGGWLKNELIKFCIILDIPYNKNDTKAIFCKNIKKYLAKLKDN